MRRIANTTSDERIRSKTSRSSRITRVNTLPLCSDFHRVGWESNRDGPRDYRLRRAFTVKPLIADVYLDVASPRKTEAIPHGKITSCVTVMRASRGAEGGTRRRKAGG